jgi:hypothetical protein
MKKALEKEKAKEAEKSKKKDKKDKKKKNKKNNKDDKAERVPFDRERDLKIVNIDTAKQEAMIKRAAQLNSKFYTGKQKFL